MIVRAISGADLQALSLLQKKPPAGPAMVEQSFGFSNHEGLQLHFKTTQMPGLIITHLNGTAAEQGAIATDDAAASVSMNFQLQGSVHSHHFAYGNPFPIRAAQHNLLYVQHGAGTHAFEKGPLQALNIRFDAGYFHSLLQRNEETLYGLLKKLAGQEAFLASAAMMPITTQLSAALQAILQCPLQGHFKKLYLEGKALELLAMELWQAEHYMPPTKALARADINKIHAVRDYLDVQYLMPLSLMQLARMFGLNDFKLKKGFRDVYQITVFGYIHQKRMALAAKLLAEKAVTVSEAADTLVTKTPIISVLHLKNSLAIHRVR